MEEVLQFQYGGLTVMCIAVGVFFARFWYLHRDRLFLWFMVAFWSFAVSWGVHLVYTTPSETGPHVYVFRLFGYLLIIGGIIDKNRRSS